jgi:hypothetical protein
MALSSCGGSPSNTVGEFKTVQVTAQADTIRLESDVLTGNTCSSTVSTAGTFKTDDVNVTFTSTVYPNLGGTPLAVTIDSYVVHYAPANTSSPVLPDQFGTMQGTVVDAGGSKSVSVAVVPDSLKASLVNSFGFQLCSTTTFQYFVTITFYGTELSGLQRSIPTSLNVEIADRV